MPAHKVEEIKKPFTYRARPSVVKKGKKRAKKDKTTLSAAIEEFVDRYGNDLYELQSK